MARIFMDGFESGNFGLWDVKSAAINSSLAGRTGTYCACVTFPTYPLVKYITDVSYIYTAFKLYREGTSTNDHIISFYNGSTLLGYLTILNSQVGVIGWGSFFTNYIGNYTFASNVWMLVEIYYLPHLTNGAFTIKVNGITVINVSGVKTAPSTSNINMIKLENNNADDCYYDDFILDDANWIGTSSIQGLAVTGAGTTTQFDPSTGSNYACVDEVPPSDTDYISTNTPNEVDTYACGDLTGTINSVKAVQVQARCMQEGSPAVPKIQLVTRPSSTDRVSASKNVQTFQPSSVANIWELNPDDSAAWESADVNGMEIGVKAVAS